MSDHLRTLGASDVPEIELPQEAFAGRSLLRFISKAVESDAVSVNLVSFDAGARSRPHSHDADQLLLFTSGEGVVAVDGEDDVRVREGGFAMLRGGVVHMHGASDAGPATHLSIMPTGHSTEFDCAIPGAWARWAHVAREKLAEHELASDRMPPS
jgi:quercetin dioxygenase-like cupin family protein